ncbi:hypothetical protein C0J52_15545 [Blattella germanica]|nr:hypothetical protein C0J52_15545 [Blattella germanica]
MTNKRGAVLLPQYGFHNNLILFQKCAEMNQEVRPTPTNCTKQVNPVELKEYVHKSVEIVTIDGEKITGTIYTIDPVSESVILLTKKNEKSCMDIVMGHAVKSIVVSSSCVQPEPDDLFPTVSVNISKEEVQQRKQKLKNWLCSNRIPIEEDGDLLKVKDALQIHPPYGQEHCLSGNEIILGRVQTLIASMPEEVEM